MGPGIKLQPIDDRVIVKRINKDHELSDGGIVLPGDSTEVPWGGIVVAVGPGPRILQGGHDPLLVKEGDYVLFRQNTGSIVGRNLLVLRETELLAIVKTDGADGSR